MLWPLLPAVQSAMLVSSMNDTLRNFTDAEEPPGDPRDKWRVLFLLALAELLAMATWFSATAVLPALTRAWQLR